MQLFAQTVHVRHTQLAAFEARSQAARAEGRSDGAEGDGDFSNPVFWETESRLAWSTSALQGTSSPPDRAFSNSKRRTRKQSAETSYADRYYKDMRVNPHMRKVISVTAK
jgi:hypothetical protein